MNMHQRARLNIANSAWTSETGSPNHRGSLAHEPYPDAFLLAPDSVTCPAQLLARDNQCEAIGKPQGAGNFQGCSRTGYIAYPTRDGVATELNRPDLQYPPPGCDPIFLGQTNSLQQIDSLPVTNKVLVIFGSPNENAQSL